MLLVQDEERPSVSLKCEPWLAELYREKYAAVTPGFHLNKRHWNSVALDGSISAEEIREMITHSYECVVAKLPKRERERLVHAIGRPEFLMPALVKVDGGAV